MSKPVLVVSPEGEWDENIDDINTEQEVERYIEHLQGPFLDIFLVFLLEFEVQIFDRLWKLTTKLFAVIEEQYGTRPCSESFL